MCCWQKVPSALLCVVFLKLCVCVLSLVVVQIQNSFEGIHAKIQKFYYYSKAPIA